MTLFKEETNKETEIYTKDSRDLLYLGIMYCEMLRKYFRKSFLFPVSQNHSAYDKQIVQLKKLVDILDELGVDAEQYMKAQFELLTPWIKKTGRGYLTFNMMITPNAKKRWEEWLDRIDNQNELKVDKRNVQYSKAVKNTVKIVVYRSITEFYNIIKYYKKTKLLCRETALKQLEIALKMGLVDAMYVYINPMINEKCENDYLKDIWNKTDKRLSKGYKEQLQRLFEETRKEIERCEVEEYV